ncbi:hypothetical protein VPHK469_0063 [Vibrio phage K469]
MLEPTKVETHGTISYVLDVHMIHDRFLAVMLKASPEPNDEFIGHLQESGGLVVVEQKKHGEQPDAIPEMLYLARAAADDEREIKSMGGQCAYTTMSMCPIVDLNDILREIKAGVKLQPEVTPRDWLINQCRGGLQDFTIRANSYATRDMRIKEDTVEE